MGVCCRLVNTRREEEVLEVEYHDSLPLSFFLSCGNIMAGEKEVKRKRPAFPPSFVDPDRAGMVQAGSGLVLLSLTENPKYVSTSKGRIWIRRENMP